MTLWNKLQRERGFIIYAWDFHTKTSLKEWKMKSEIVKKGGVEELWGTLAFRQGKILNAFLVLKAVLSCKWFCFIQGEGWFFHISYIDNNCKHQCINSKRLIEINLTSKLSCCSAKIKNHSPPFFFGWALAWSSPSKRASRLSSLAFPCSLFLGRAWGLLQFALPWPYEV